MISFQQHQLPYPEGAMKGPAGVVRHRPAVDLFRQTAGNAQVRIADQVHRRTTRGPDEIVDRSQFLRQLPEWRGVLYPEINGVRRKPTVIVKHQVKTLMTAADSLYPAYKGLFHRFACLECRHGDMRLVPDIDPQTIVLEELLLLVQQLIVQIAVRIDDQKVLDPPVPFLSCPGSRPRSEGK